MKILINDKLFFELTETKFWIVIQSGFGDNQASYAFYSSHVTFKSWLIQFRIEYMNIIKPEGNGWDISPFFAFDTCGNGFHVPDLKGRCFFGGCSDFLHYEKWKKSFAIPFNSTGFRWMTSEHRKFKRCGINELVIHSTDIPSPSQAWR